MSGRKRFEEPGSDYDPTDSDEDYDENERILLSKVRKGKEVTYSDSEEEVFGVGGDDDEEDQSDIALSDVEGQGEDDEVPDVKSWGKDKRKFYSTDYVDPDYGGFQGRDGHLAELEEEEARNLQKQLAEQLDDDDFSLDIPNDTQVTQDVKITEEVIKSDISKLTKRQRLQILKKESPEFFSLLEDFNIKMLLLRDYLIPVLRRYKKGQIPNCSAMEFVVTHNNLILNYCTNIYMYLLLKASRINVQNHPVIKRLYQYRQLLSQLQPVFDDNIKPQIELILKEECDQVTEDKPQLQILQKMNKSNKKKKALVPLMKSDNEIEEDLVKSGGQGNDNEDISRDDIPDGTKRAITYQIAKNKGLTPHRKKEQRNPRVKHRNKFRKAKIRRKGAVRTPRTEVKRYGGEISGIKSNVSKSIKIK